MNIFFTFILGVVVGWLIEWIIDLFYWRKRFAQREANSALVRMPQGVTNPQIEVPSRPAAKPDDLKIIKGIGAVIEGKLNAAGIYTFQQLGNLTAGELRQILGNVIERLSDEDSLLQQARQLARGKE